MADPVTRNNHYVPEWYQRGFIESGQTVLYYLNMHPYKVLPDGRTIQTEDVRQLGPRRCFFERDLYSTYFGNQVNDEVEKYLFGSVDDRGSTAVRAFAGGDQSAMHFAFQDFFEYLDAQRLRTPKGLDWIRSRYSALEQTQLMVEMQGLRFMHCTMWTEGVREIVSAEESEIKFIVSDHPVTLYNAARPPTSAECAYPEDPPIEWAGTQTVFVLDANTCLILTHLEYAQDPKLPNITAPRTHARYRGQSMVRTDAFVRTRKLSQSEVVSINFLLKSRARQYLAASNQEWLYPEKSFTGTWESLAEVLLPKDELWQFGGEIFAKYRDGSIHYQDAFGRTSRAHEYLRRKRKPVSPNPNDLCGCGSGRKFKHCCKNVAEDERPTWEVYSIRERNLMLSRAVQDILGLTADKTWDDVRRGLRDEQVTRIHEAFEDLWPKDTDIVELLPRPRKGTFRAVYLGMADPRSVSATILGWLPYFDEVIVAHPFLNPLRLKPEFSPTKSPAKHKAQTLKNVFLLLMLEPFIRGGFVHLIPDPGDFNPEFSRSALNLAELRTEGWEPEYPSGSIFEKLAKDDQRRLMNQLPEASLKSLARKAMPDISDEQINVLIQHTKSEMAADPFALLQSVKPGESGAQFLFFKSYTLESAMFLASLTGSIIYTDVEAHWQQLHMHALQRDSLQDHIWKSVVDSLGGISFPIELGPEKVLTGLSAGRFGSIRPALRRMIEAAQQPSAAQCADQVSAQLTKAAVGIQREWAGVQSAGRLAGHIELSIPLTGFDRNEVRRLLLTFGRAKAIPIPFAMLIRFDPDGR